MPDPKQLSECLAAVTLSPNPLDDLFDPTKTPQDFLAFKDPDSRAYIRSRLVTPETVARLLAVLYRSGDTGRALAMLLDSNDTVLTDRFLSVIKAQLKVLAKETTCDTEWCNQLVFYLAVLLVLASLRAFRVQFLTLILPFATCGKAADRKRIHSHLAILVATFSDLTAELPNETHLEVQQHLELLIENSAESFADFSQLITLLGILFPVLPEPCRGIFLSGLFQAVIQHYYTGKASIAESSHKRMSLDVLSCFCEACADESCREVICSYSPVLWDMTDNAFREIRILATLILVKIQNESQKLEQERALKGQKVAGRMGQLYDMAITNVQAETGDYLGPANETLAYLTLIPRYRKQMRGNETLLEFWMGLLVNAVKETSVPDSSLLYGIVTILEKLSDIQEPVSADGKTKRFMEEYAKRAQTGVEEEREESTEQISAFNSGLLTRHQLVSIFTANTLMSRESISAAAKNSVAKIVYNIAWPVGDKATKHQIVIQGGLNLLIEYLLLYSDINAEGFTRSGSNARGDARLYALRALAKVLIANNPLLVFKKYAVLTVVPFLVELLGSSDSEELTALDGYEALLALTNLASLDDMSLKNTIVKRAFGRIYELLTTSPKEEMQTACLELLNNVITSPVCLEHFFDLDTPKTADSLRARLDYLLLQVDSENSRIQSIVLGLLINASEYEFISMLLAGEEKLARNLFSILTIQTEDQDLVMRVSYLLVNLAQSVQSDQAKLAKFKRILEPWKLDISGCIKAYSKDEEIVRNFLLVCRSLQL
ncbi:hypothetical protein BABINDRAFT_128769 [Babjeviella inositovora NRRL Y-12698]|uniref:UNC-45/Cro1/She4 central domain-containing protein n=1 Tax=Babjeviella inositovora NRRL Y-12698 TaxID=984486 RepID=A0A1E3QR08_9ASCO|nr:uncharacterized protein BABINDRAFT_128769 [Babjeviella inositovora NRRL Y-12698]ODQ80111.1 hypothetical protein BABINDRAFT_128769 [Babjeviella inositovora NRRL Y-12698]